MLNFRHSRLMSAKHHVFLLLPSPSAFSDSPSNVASLPATPSAWAISMATPLSASYPGSAVPLPSSVSMATESTVAGCTDVSTVASVSHDPVWPDPESPDPVSAVVGSGSDTSGICSLQQNVNAEHSNPRTHHYNHTTDLSADDNDWEHWKYFFK